MEALRVAALSLGALLSAAACTGGAHQSGRPVSYQDSPTASAPAQLRDCPHRVPASARNASAPAHELVWADPTSAEICRYYATMGLTGRGVPHGTLYGHRRLEAATARRLATDLDAIPRWPKGRVVPCPMAIGTHDLLLFGYDDGRTLQVMTTPDGCPSFTNGRYTSGWFSPALQRYFNLINRLVPPKYQHAR